jgi:hypothetical protein
MELKNGLNPTIRDVIEKYSIENGYDGLFNEDSECACFNGDLISCGFETNGNCEFGYKMVCPNCKTHSICISNDFRDFLCPECEEGEF